MRLFLMKRIIYFSLFLFIFIIAILLLNDTAYYNHRFHVTMTGLRINKRSIETFKNAVGRHPDSLLEIEQNMVLNLRTSIIFTAK